MGITLGLTVGVPTKYNNMKKETFNPKHHKEGTLCVGYIALNANGNEVCRVCVYKGAVVVWLTTDGRTEVASSSRRNKYPTDCVNECLRNLGHPINERGDIESQIYEASYQVGQGPFTILSIS